MDAAMQVDPTSATAVADGELVVREIRGEAEGVVSLVLAAPDDSALPAWQPGAHLDLHLTPALERQYSLCGDPADRSIYRVAVLREPESRGGSEYVHSRLRLGDTIRVRGPRNHFALIDAGSYRFVAGGIGITPILPMLAAAEARGADWHLLYGGRQRASMAFLAELEKYGDRVEIAPQDERGLLDLDSEVAALGTEGLLYCCGPAALLDAIEERTAGLDRDALHVERFSAKQVAVRETGERPVTIECARSGVTVEVDAGTTILDALREHGLELESSCEEGICGTCETRVLDGTPDHRDSILSESEKAEGRLMMICCSRAVGEKLVLDI